MDSELRIGREVVTVRALIDRMAEIRSSATFLISPEAKQEVTFEELRQRANAHAHRLASLGLSKGDKVAFMLDNGLLAAELFLGAVYGGFVSVPLNVGGGQSQLGYILNHCDTAMVFVSDEYNHVLQSAMAQAEGQIKVIPVPPDRDLAYGAGEFGNTALPEIDKEDDALIAYTSGSTSQPKGVVISHRNILAGASNTTVAYRLCPQDHFLCVLPLYHINAQRTLISTLLSGGCVVLPHRFNVTSFWDWIADYHCTWSFLVPTIISHLLNWTDPYTQGKEAGLKQVRFMRSSSAPLAPAQHQAFEEKFKLVLIEAMGSTEAGGTFLSNPLPPGDRKIGSPGIPHGCEARILDAVGRELSPGQTGEIVVRGQAVMKGYYKNPEATAEVINPDGWLHTGDLGYRDEDGYFFIVGRAKELIIKGGENIAPREIDEALQRHPAVMEAAAVGIHDPYMGEDIVVYIVPKPGERINEQELLHFCEEKLGQFKTPTKAYFVNDLPKGPTGKVQRVKLSEMAERALEGMESPRQRESQVEEAGSRSALAGPRLLEEAVAKVWAEVLGLPSVIPQDNFFDLGGHSLLATQLISRIRHAFRVDFPLRTVFENPTVAGLAAQIAKAQAAADPEQMVEILADLESLSDQEAQSLVDQDRTPRNG